MKLTLLYLSAPEPALRAFIIFSGLRKISVSIGSASALERRPVELYSRLFVSLELPLLKGVIGARSNHRGLMLAISQHVCQRQTIEIVGRHGGLEGGL